MEQQIIEKAQSWLNMKIDADSKASIEQMLNAEDNTELVDSFYKDLEFGTGGMRGIMGVGSNRMNQYTIGKATQGLSNYLLKTYPGEQISAAVAYDPRNNSRFFAEITAAVFSANGIKVYLFSELRATPELSFAIRHLGCKSGVVITASHNPKEYNGFKAYWNDGCQVTAPHDKNIVAEVNAIASIDEVKFEKNADLIEPILEEVDDAFLKEIKARLLSPEAIKNQKDMKIVFTGIHGTGNTLTPRLLSEMGFENVHVVQEQAVIDGNFPTVVYPNPEEAEALSMALAKAKELDAEVLMGTDPDADRVGIAVKNHKGEWQLLNGNQTGAMLLAYVLRRWKELGKITGKEFTCSTVVTTGLLEKMSKAAGVEYFNVLTGFKFIGEKIKELEGQKTFIGGGEESYGYLFGDYVRDKDAIQACAMVAEAIAWIKDQGLTVFDFLMEVYEEHGLYLENLISLTKKGKAGADEIQAMMAAYRENPPMEINGSKLVKLIDYQASIVKDVATGEETSIDLPKSNVLQFFTEDGSKISARPSGTEPKIKFYFSVNTLLASKDAFDATYASLEARIEAIKKSMELV